MRAVSDYDLRHNFAAFAIYELPFGKGKPVLGNANKFVNALIGNATQIAPLTAGTVKNANIKGGSRDTLRGDGIFNIDSSVSKWFDMPYKESHKLQFRAEVFNLTNSVRFDVNTISLNLGASSTFGKYSSTLGDPRVMQFGAKYVF